MQHHGKVRFPPSAVPAELGSSRSLGGLAFSAKSSLVVADPNEDARHSDGARPQPAYRWREKVEVHHRKCRHRRDVRPDHPSHVRVPPEILVRGRMDELPEVTRRKRHPDHSENDRHDA